MISRIVIGMIIVTIVMVIVMIALLVVPMGDAIAMRI